MARKNDSNEIRLTRIYDAPVRAVWDAWTDPDQVAQWWGPRGFTLTTHSKDLRPGGHWTYTMHGPDGVDYPNHTIYHEVEECSRLVYDHGANDDRPPLFRVTVTFTEVEGKTQMDMRMTLATPEIAETTRRFIKSAGGEATWDRLGEHLSSKLLGKEPFIINRSFDTSLSRMFEMWTDPEHFRRWLPPVGFEMKFIRVDLRAGGSGFYVMTGGDTTMYGRIQYLDIRRPDRIVYTQQFCDEHERVSRHSMAPLWPEAMLTTVSLTEEGPERTRVTVIWEPVEPVTSAELEAFIKERGGMTRGWTGSFDKLEAILDDPSRPGHAVG